MDTLAALRLQIEWGADEAILDAPLDRLSPGRRAAPAPTITTPAPRVTMDGATRGQPNPETGRAASLDALREIITGFTGCALRESAAHTVLPEGRIDARLILIGEAPSADDDRAGRVFAGAQGEFLERALNSIGLTRAELLIAPLLPWRPPGDRPPSPSELSACLSFLHHLLALSSCSTALILGPVATRALFGASRRMKRGSWAELNVPGRSDPLIVLPSASLAQTKRVPAMKRELWADLRQIYRRLNPGMT